MISIKCYDRMHRQFMGHIRLHAVHDLLELFEFIVESFGEISELNDYDTSGKAQRLQKSMLDEEFIIALLILSKGFGIWFTSIKTIAKSKY